jgi:hypothetical protein
MARRTGWFLSVALVLAGSSGCGLLCDRYCERERDHCCRERCGCAPQQGCYSPQASSCCPAPGVYTPQPQSQYCP